MLEKCPIFRHKPLNNNDFLISDTMNRPERGAWYRAGIMVSTLIDTMIYAMKNTCLAMPNDASRC